jgi:curved DNA-binding protein CbpA
MSDPYQQLGVPPTADDDTIRAAYLGAIRACPPERDRQRFEQVRAAFEAIATERQRLAHALFDASAPTSRGVLERLSAGWKARTPTEAALYQLLGRHD